MSQVAANKIDRKWVREDKHMFSVYPSLRILESHVSGKDETWLELAQFYQDDLIWLLSLDHHRFWSHMIYSDNPRQFLLSFLKGSPPSYVKSDLLMKEDMWKLQNAIEHLVFLVYVRLCSKNEAVKNLGETLYNNYLFTVPVFLDLCLIYGTSNRDLVGKMINEVVTLAPDFLEDLQEVVPSFFRVLRMARDKFSVERLAKLTDKCQLKSNEVRDFVYYLHDSVATVEIFLELYPGGCDLFRTSERVAELVSFYSNVLPEAHSQCLKIDLRLSELMENTRIDLLKMVKNILDFGSSYKGEEFLDEYLTLMMELLPEPAFLSDYNLMFSVEFEIESAVKNCPGADTIKVKHILDGVALAARENEKEVRNEARHESGDSSAKFNSLVTEVKDIFPHLESDFIRRCLKYYENNTERVIAAILENTIPISVKEPEPVDEPRVEPKKTKHQNLNELLNDREELNEIRHRYAQLSYVDDTYDDDYDDTYDDNVDVVVKETTDESVRRPFVIPRVLRGAEENEEESEEEEESESEVNPNHFLENPEVARERMEKSRGEKRDVVGRGRGHGQTKQVTRNREYKEAHKSRVANHNRKKQASRKMNRGLIPS